MPIQWIDGDTISSWKLNTSTYHRMTGLEMEDLEASFMVSGMQIYCTESSSVYTAGVYYRRALDNNSFEVIGLDTHTHTDALSGGTLDEVSIANMTTTLLYDKRFARAG